MCKVLLLSHGNLARELLATSQMIYGEVDGIDCISLLSGTDLAYYEEEILSKVQQSPEGILVLVDIFGGTPFITASRIYNQNQGVGGNGQPAEYERFGIKGERDQMRSRRNYRLG